MGIDDKIRNAAEEAKANVKKAGENVKDAFK